MKIWFLIVFLVIGIFENIFFENIFSKIVFLFNTTSIYISAYYVFVSLFGFLSVTSLFFIKEKLFFGLAICLFFLTYGVELVYKDVNSFGFTLNDLSIVLHEADAFAMEALVTYSTSIKHALFILLIVLAVMFLLRKVIVKHTMFIRSPYIIFFFILALGLAYSITYKTTGATQTRPNIIKMLNTGVYYASNRLYYGEREFLKTEPTASEKYQNIILIVDESIGGEYLSINGYEQETTPYLKSIEKHFLNLGLASSAANCSAKSNLILMSGIQLNELPDYEHRALKKASIFQYAKNAGYKTHYISGQSLDLNLQNHMTKYDLEHIDNFVQPKEHYKHKSMPEESIVRETANALMSTDKNFIFIVKHGSHFSWEDSYPKEEQYFLPSLEPKDALSLDVKEKALNSYLNSIRYNVDLFFKFFLEKTDFFNREDTLIIYTADHGQSILEKGRASTHCDSTNPPLSQGVVPLLLFTNLKDTIIRSIDFKANSYNHYQLFPSIQNLMGYDDIKAETLFDKVSEEPKQVFVSGDIFGRVRLQSNDIHLK